MRRRRVVRAGEGMDALGEGGLFFMDSTFATGFMIFGVKRDVANFLGLSAGRVHHFAFKYPTVDEA